MKGFAIFFLLSIWVCSVYGAYCPHRPDQHCDSFWSSGSSGGNNEGFWNLYSCAARGFPAAPGSPCYDTTILRDAMTADPTPPELDPHSPSAAYDFAEWFTQESVGNRGYWNELQREAQINKPRTSNWGQVGHIALFETGSGSPFLINHGYLPFKRSIPQSIAVRSTLPNPQAPEIVSEELASEARWSVCLTDDCSQTTAPQLFGAEPYESDFLSAHNTLPTYFNWNPCGQSSGVHIWVNGELLLTFVGVGSRSGWSDGRVVLGQCVDSECSDVRVISVGAGSRDLPPVEHQCLTGFAGVGPRIVVASDGNPSLMWRNKYSPEQVVYLHCQDASCSSYDSPKFFTLESEATGSSALWWDLVASERGIWIVSLNDNKDAYVTGLTNNTFNNTNALNGYNYDAYIQITSCTDNVCSTVGTQFPSPHSSEADTPLYEEWAFSDFGWRWSTNNRDVAFAAQTYSSGVTGDGFPMWVGQIERGPQSGIAWVVCSCRDNECAVPECHFLADVNTIMDPAISQCVALGESLTTESPHRFVHGSSRQRILNGGSDGLPVIVQQVSSFCVEILPLFAQSTLARRTISRLEESLQIVNGNVQASPIEFSYDSQKQRKVLLQSQKTTYIHCLDATCSEASVSALESPKVASVSHESGYNQVDSAFISDDQILTVYSPDATSNEQSYSWTQGCAYELFEYDSNGNRYVTYNTNYERTDVLDANFRSKAGNTLSIQLSSFAFDGMGYLIIVADDGSGDRIYAIDLVTGVEVYSICIETIRTYVSLEVDLASQFIILVQHDGNTFYFDIASWNLPDTCAHTDTTLLDTIGIGCGPGPMAGGLTVIPNRVTPIYSFVGNCVGNNPEPYAAVLNGNWFQVGPNNANYIAFDATYDYYNRAVLLTTNDNALRFYHYDESPISNTGNNRYRLSPAGQLTPSFNKKFRPNEFCSPNYNSNFGGASANDLANGESGIPNFVLLRNYLGIAPTPRTGGIKTWLTNRWSSPNGQPCQEDSVAQLVSADDVVFLCSGLRLGDNQVWGTTPINGWTRLWEWQEIGWGLRWRWQGDIHFGTDHSYDGSQFTDIASFYELNPQ